MEDELALYNFRIYQRKRKIAALLYLSHCLKQKRKQFYIRPIYLRRREKGYHDNLIQEMRLGDQEQFFNFHGMATDKFDDLLVLVGLLIQKNTLLRADVISPSERLSLTLRYLAAGDSLSSLSFAYRISRASISNILRQTCEAIWTVLVDVVLKKPTQNNWLQVAEGFFKEWNFPHCVGAIDGKHVVMQAPDKAGSLYYNYKGTHSLVLLAVCDADYCFTLVAIGGTGRQSDGGVFRQSSFGKAMVENKLELPPPTMIPGTQGCVSPFLFVGDAAFPMSQTLMRPYPLLSLTEKQRIFNYRLSRARRIIENTFGIMVACWRIFRKPICTTVSNLDKTIKAAVCLHNWLQKSNQRQQARDRRYCPANFVDRKTSQGAVQEGEWRTDVDDNCAMQNLGRLGANTYTRSAEQTRNNLADYFMDEGLVPWHCNSAGLDPPDEA